MKRMALFLAAALLAALCAGCGQSNGFPDNADFAAAIQSSRGEELNEAFAVVTYEAGGAPQLATNPGGVSDEEGAQLAQMTADTLGLDGELFEQYAVSASLIITKAYAVGVFRPAEGQTDAAMEAVEAYVSNVRASFENYLPDQYAVAKQAVVRQYPSGEILLALCEDASAQADALEQALNA